MNNFPLISIGDDIQFFATAPSFTMLRNTLEPRWSEQERVSRQPAGQFIGPANATIDINGVLYPGSDMEMQTGVSSRGLIEKIATAANSGTVFSVVAMLLVDQSGTAAGQFYVRSLQNERTTFDQFGAKKIDFQVTLRAYGTDLQ